MKIILIYNSFFKFFPINLSINGTLVDRKNAIWYSMIKRLKTADL